MKCFHYTSQNVSTSLNAHPPPFTSSCAYGYFMTFYRPLEISISEAYSEPCQRSNPASIYFLKVHIRNNRTRCEIRSKLTIKTPERRQRQRRRSGVFIVDFEHISHLVQMFMLLTLNM